MGVDYTANYGIGFKVNSNHEDFEEDPYSFLDDILKDSAYEHFEVGSGNYTGKDNEYYVALSANDSEIDSVLTQRVENLKAFLVANDLISESDKGGLVGGLHIW